MRPYGTTGTDPRARRSSTSRAAASPWLRRRGHHLQRLGALHAKGQKNCGSGRDEYCDEPTIANVEISLGQYELLLSNYAGANCRLAYAAYGLLNFGGSAVTPQRIGRMQIFHHGLDAFADSAGRRATDLSGSSRLEGTFRGKTMAWIVTSKTKRQLPGRFDSIENLFRTRGDIELRACIGGSTCALQDFTPTTPVALPADMIAGRITNLEYVLGNRPGGHLTWATSDSDGVAGANALKGKNNPRGDFRAGYIELRPAAINADGTYDGVTRPGRIDGFKPGVYEGAFYGPAGAGLETAGTWRVNTAPWEANVLNIDAIIGSFGAVCEGICRPALSP